MSGPRRVGLNLMYLVPGGVGGTEIYARRLLDALARLKPDVEFVAFSGNEAHASLSETRWPANVRLVRVPVRAASKPLRVAAELTALPVADARARIDLLHSLGTTSPLATRSVRVVTVHDLIYDHYPESFPPLARRGLQLLVPRGARRAQRVQVSSHATKAELVEAFGLAPEKIDVVHLGLGMRDVESPTPAAELRERLALGDAPVVLSVSAALPHKNLDRLLEAFARLDGDMLLVLVGHAGRVQERLAAHAAELGVAERVRFTGWVSDEDVEGLYRLAALFAYPSLHEGFGMPVLEAMRRGVPVASSDATSLPEVAGDAAELFDPRDVDAIAAALRRLLGDPARRAELVRLGERRAAGFGWDRTAGAAWGSYERAWAESRAKSP
jgi:glycosyltransferase involved in cell wall biosynthesis